MDSYVYFIQDTRTGHVKIGRTGDPQERLRHLQCGSASPLRLLGYIEGGRSVERSFHSRLAEHCVHGEWFTRHATFEVLRGLPPERWLWLNHGHNLDGLRPSMRKSAYAAKRKKRWTAERRRAAQAN